MSGSPFGIGEYYSSKNASEAQTQAADKAAEVQLQMYNQSRADTAPWRAAGEGALNALWGTMGTQPQQTGGGYWTEPEYTNQIVGYKSTTNWDGMPVQEPIYGQIISKPAQFIQQPVTTTPGTPGTPGLIQQGPGEFTESPSYQFALNQGLQAQQRAASATGRLGSGAYLKDATTYAKNLASEEYQNFLNRYYQSLDPYFRLAGYGSNVAMSGQSASTQTGNALANTYMQGGQAQAAGILGQYNSIANSMGNAGNQVGNWLVQNKPWAQNTGWQAGGGLGTVGAAGTVAGTGLTAAEMNAMMWL